MYIICFLLEVLRMWPPAVAMDRSCTKDYNMGRPNDKAKRDFIVSNHSILEITMENIQKIKIYVYVVS